MAKLYAELTAHETARKVTKSSNTRIVLEVYEGNSLIGTLKAYPIAQPEGGHRITWQHAKRGTIDFIQIEDPTQPKS